MRKSWLWLLVGVLVFSVSACAMKGDQKTTKVKCPACGYEFEVPINGR